MPDTENKPFNLEELTASAKNFKVTVPDITLNFDANTWANIKRGSYNANSLNSPELILDDKTLQKLSDSQKAFNRVTQITSPNKHNYSDFINDIYNTANLNGDDKLSRSERRALRKLYGISRKDMRAIAKDYNGKGNGVALKKYTSGLLKRYYINDKGEIIEEGLGDNYNADDFNTAYEARVGKGYAGTDLNTISKKWDDDVNNWRKNTVVTYDPIEEKFMASGFNNGKNIDVTNLAWAKEKQEEARNNWFEANKKAISFNSEDGSYLFNNKKIKDPSWLDENFTRKLRALDYLDDVAAYGKSANFEELFGAVGDWSKLNKILNLGADIQKSSDYEEKYRQGLDDYLKDYTMKNGSVAGTALYNYLKDLDLLRVGKGTNVAMNPNHPYLKALQIMSPLDNEQYKLFEKNGGSLSYIKVRNAYKKGGQINKLRIGGNSWWRTAADLVPVLGSGLLAYDKYVEGDDISDVQMAMSVGGDLLTLTPLGWVGKAGKLLKPVGGLVQKVPGVSSVTQSFSKLGKAISKEKQALDLLIKFRKNKSRALSIDPIATAKKDRELVRAYKKAKKETNALRTTGRSATIDKQMAQLAGLDTRSALSKWTTGTVRTMGWMTGVNARSQLESDSRPDSRPDSEENYVELGPYYPQLKITSSNFYATGNDWFYKNGGTLHMNKINYFLAGGAMAPAAPAQGALDILAQVALLVLAAMSGDEKATQTILQIMLAAQLGDQLAALIALMIQEIAKQMQGQAPAAKNGAKLAYIKSLKTGCPEGYEVSYHREGGRLCKECVAKASIGAKLKEAAQFPPVAGTAIDTYDGRVLPEVTITAKNSNISTTTMHKGGGGLKKKLACGDKTKKKKCEAGAELAKGGAKTKKKCETGAELKCGGNAKKAACGTSVNKEKCGGKAKKKCLNGGNLELLRNMFENYNK